jgi:RNA polymerase sigma-70 factor (ECF subfamily)
MSTNVPEELGEMEPGGRGVSDDAHARFLALHMAHQGTLFGYLLAAVHDFQAAEDILQQVTLILWRKFGEFRPGAPWLPWALGIARREVARHYRSRPKRQSMLTMEILDQVLPALVEDAAPMADRRRVLAKCIEKLPPYHRQLVRLRYEAGRSLEELSQHLKRTVAAVNMILVRVRRALVDCTRRAAAREG